MQKILLVLILSCLVLLLLTGCGPAPQETVPPTAEPSETVPPTQPETTAPQETEPLAAEKKEVVVYFANWYLDTKTAQEGAEVCSIPWDQVTYVNHAFWAVEPADGSTETSFARREAGRAPGPASGWHPPCRRRTLKMTSPAPWPRDCPETTLPSIPILQSFILK